MNTNTAERILMNLDYQILLKYQETRNNLALMRYIDDPEKKTFLSGKLDAYEDVALIVKTMIATLDSK